MTEKFFINDAEKIIPPVNDSPYRRVLCFGDVHAALDKLNRLLEKLAPAEDDLLIFLGDYFNKYKSKNLETLLRLDELNRRENVIMLCGNSDDDIMESFRYDKSITAALFFRYFFRNSRELFDSYKEKNIPRIFSRFMKNLPSSYQLTIGGRKYFCCHSGIEVGTPLERQEKDWLIGQEDYENFYLNYSGDAVIIVGHKSPKKIFNFFPEIFGDAKPDLTKPIKIPTKNILMLDTRAKEKNGFLSCVDIISGEFWQS